MKLIFVIPFLIASFSSAHAEVVGTIEIAQNADCYSVGQNFANQNGGTLSSATDAVQNGQNVCRIIVVVPAKNGERPKRIEVIVPR